MMLVEKDMIITDERQIVNNINEHFVAITKQLSLKPTVSSKASDCDFFFMIISVKRRSKKSFYCLKKTPIE